MKRALIIAVLAAALLSFPLGAHHSYGGSYYLYELVTLKGTVSKVSFKDPHVVLTIETKNSGTWEAEWTQATGLNRRGINENTLRVGDVLEIEASPSRNESARIVSALRAITRRSDGWRWVTEEKWPEPRVIE